jgi:site-specific recombinase XerD
MESFKMVTGVPVEEFLHDFIVDEKSHSPDNDVSANSYEKKLFSLGKGLNGIQALKKAGVEYSNQITRTTLKRTKKFLVEAHPITYASAIVSAIQVALEWGKSQPQYGLNITDRDLKAYRLPSKRPYRIVQLTDLEMQKLRSKRLGITDLEHLQNRLILLVLALGHGIRSANEMVKINEDDFDGTLMELIINRKGKQKQSIPLRKQDCNDIEYWIKQKRDHINNYVKRNPGTGIDSNALFIKIRPAKRNGKINWRMPSTMPSTIFKNLRINLNINENKVVGTLRHSSCTMQQRNAMAMGYHERYASTLNAHSEQTERDYYVSILGSEVEILSRFPDENINLCENIVAHSIDLYRKNPSKIRHVACAMEAMQVMGRLQFRQILDQYRSSNIDLDSMPKHGIDFHDFFNLKNKGF